MVIKGISECPKGTARKERLLSDDHAVTSILKKISPSFNDMSLRECRRLGKYLESNVSPRPLLVTLSRSSEVSAFLDKRYALAKDNIYIKPDLSLEERKVESILLKERRVLIEEYNVKRNLIRLSSSLIQGYMAVSQMTPLPAISYWKTSFLNQQDLILLLSLILHRNLLITPQSPQM